MGDSGDRTEKTPGDDLWAGLLHALIFLTRVPLAGAHAVGSLANAMWAFPIVGVLVGVVGGVVFWFGEILGLGPWLAAIAAVVAQLLITGALHEDGLADLADGFGGGASATRKLEIMRDSQIGTFGTIAIVVALMARVGALGTIGAAIPVVVALVAAGALSRSVMVAIMRFSSPARVDGLAVTAGRPAADTTAVAVALSIVAACGLLAFSFAAMVAALIAAALVAVGVGALARRQIGGYTGDVLGTAQQVTEIIVLMIVVVAIS